jgi:Sarcosine oxidase, gamma subunit family
MADLAESLRVAAVTGMQVASLRHFETTGGFAALVQEITGFALPGALRLSSAAGEAGGAGTMLAWRSPTETLLLSTDSVQFAALARQLSGAPDGCMVDQSGGLCILEVRGVSARDLLLRLGSCEAAGWPNYPCWLSAPRPRSTSWSLSAPTWSTCWAGSMPPCPIYESAFETYGWAQGGARGCRGGSGWYRRSVEGTGSRGMVLAYACWCPCHERRPAGARSAVALVG